MSDSRTHRTAGAVTALCRARSPDPLHVLVEVIGGAVGGDFGGGTPDLIDVPTRPRHRAGSHLALGAHTPAGLPLLA